MGQKRSTKSARPKRNNNKSGQGPSGSIKSGQASSAVARPPRTQEDEKYYIYASTSGKAPSARVKILDSDTATDKFVASLNKDQVIILAATPEPTASFDDSDATRKWLTNLDPDASAALKLDTNIDSFIVQFKAPWSLTFSSAADVLLFTFGAPPTIGENASAARIQPPGLDADGTMLTCGLDFTQTEDIKGCAIKDLFKYADLAGMVDLLPSGIPDLPVILTTPKPGDGPKRNALWFVPSLELQTTVRLQFQLTVFDALQDILCYALKGFTLKSADAIYKKMTVLAATEKGNKPLDEGVVLFSIQCSVQAGEAGAPAVSMTAGVEFSPSGICLTLLFTSEKPLSGILKWLAWLIGDDALEGFVNEMLNKAENGTKILPNFNLRRLSLGLDNLKNKDQPVLASFSFDIEVTANFGRGSKPNPKPVVFLISYHWSRISGGFGTLAGELWNSFDPSRNQDLLPDSELWTILLPITPDPAPSVDIASLIPTQTLVKIPDTLPSEITRVYVSLSQDSFAVGGTVSAKPVSPSSVPQPYLGQVVLDAAFSWGKSSAFSLKFAISAGITPSQTSIDQTTAVLKGSLSYDSATKTWDLQASINGLYASTLAEFFDSDSRSHVTPLIESIAIDTLSAEYKYTGITEGPDKGKSAGSEFTIKGNLLIAGLELGLLFHTDKEGFKFYATVNPKDKEATIGEVLTGILGDDDQLDLPDFVTDMKLVGSQADVFRIDVEKKKTKEKEVQTDSFQFLAQLRIAKLSLAFAQLHSSDWGPTAPSKRLIEVAINGFPDMEIDIPLVGTLKQPLDELYFLWVQDPPQASSKDPTKQAGLTRQDLAQLNSGLQDPLIVKDKFQEKKPTDLMVGVGCHFAVIIHDSQGNRSCLVDYDFMKPTQAPNAENTQRALRPAEKKGVKAGDEDDGGPSAQAPYKKTAGPLSISNVGLKYKGKKLAIMFDATFEMGPLGFSLIGFSVGARFKTLDQLPDIDVDIQGLSAAFNKPPLTIEGIIRHGNDGGLDYYAGGLIVGFVPWQFQAAGFYGVVTPSDPKKSSFRSIFLFAKLEGPLITLEFAEITGITGGFGYNSNVRVPTVDQVYQFPFIANTGLDGSALQVLEKLTDPGPAGWFQPLDKTYWAAVGMKVDAFQMISIDAVVVVQFGAAINLNIFAVALADIPTVKSPEKFAHVELGISAVADLTYGTLKIEAQLSPRSFILSQDCHLTGGAALYYWFDAPHANSSKTGSFVFTLGGYHEAFDIPLDYPKPPRLAISWNLGSRLSITGQAYFAITPKACMGGGRLHASFSAGPIEAWFDAFADFLINYKPFHFSAQAGLAIGIRFNIDLLFIHTHISCEIGAQLYLWGPPLAGRVHVDFWIVGFDINFGDSHKSVDPVCLLDFYLLVLQASSQGSSSMSLFSPSRAVLTSEAEEEPPVQASVTRPKNEGHGFLAMSGLMNPSDKTERPQNELWTVRAGLFAFTIGCKMAINTVKLDPKEAPIITYGDTSKSIDVYGRPMQLQNPMTSTLIVQITQDGVSKPDAGWRFDAHVTAVPKGLWAKYDRATDPLAGGNNIKDLLNGSGGSISLMMGVDIMAPKAVMSPDPFPVFKVDDAGLQRLTASKPFPPLVNSKTAWEPGKPYPDTEIKRQYDAVYNDWVNPAWGTGDSGQKGFIRGWAAALSWDISALSDIASIPKRLKQGFSSLYVAPPLLTA